jgi:hypothetical protein
MTNTITGTDERRFATEGSTERLAGFARLGLWTLTHLRRGRTYVDFNDVRTYVDFEEGRTYVALLALGRTYVVFLALGRTYVNFNDVRTNVDVGVALTSQITCVGRTKLAASIKRSGVQFLNFLLLA